MQDVSQSEMDEDEELIVLERLISEEQALADVTELRSMPGMFLCLCPVPSCAAEHARQVCFCTPVMLTACQVCLCAPQSCFGAC